MPPSTHRQSRQQGQRSAGDGPLDPHSISILEYPKVKSMLASYASCSLGRAAVEALAPMSGAEAVRTAIAQTTELRGILQQRGRLPLAGMTDVRPAVAGTEGGQKVIEPEVLADVANTLGAAGRLQEVFEEEAQACPHLARLGERLGDFADLREAIEKVIADDGSVRDDASPALLQTRRKMETTGTRLRQKARSLARSSALRPYLQDSRVSLRGGHYVLAVRVEAKHRVDGIIHDRSQSGATVYIEPRELIILGNELEDLRFEERREVTRLLRELTALVHARREPLLTALDALAHVDLTYAKARFSRDYQMSPPEISEEGHLDVRQARHPLLVRVLERAEEPIGERATAEPDDAPSSEEPQRVVPIDYRLGEDFDVLVITGPNTGGKTVSLKTIGLLSLMAQSGMHVPADTGSAFPVYQDILADIGDEQSIEQSLSTFSSHMTNIIRILHRADPHTLVLLDELGAGTDPVEGAALGTALLDHLRSQHAKTVVTTHIGDLKAYAYRRERTMNAACEFDEKTLRPTYRVLLGQPGSSNALAIAERLGLPQPLVQEARDLAQKHRGRDSDLVAELQHARRAIEDDRERAHEKLQEAEQLRADLEDKVRAAERQAKASRREAQHEIDQQAKHLRDRVLDGLRRLRNAPAPFADRARDVERMLEEEVAHTPLAEKRQEFAASLKKDDYVHVIPFGETCRVRSVNKSRRRLQVILGHSVMEVGFDDVTWLDESKET